MLSGSHMPSVPAVLEGVPYTPQSATSMRTAKESPKKPQLPQSTLSAEQKPKQCTYPSTA